jgi:hypothetical protein
MHDTIDTAQELQFAHYRRLTGAERFLLAFDLSLTARAFATARIRREHPEWSEADVRRELLRIALLTGDGARSAE